MSKGHLLLVPRRHVPTWFDATAEERAALTAGLDRGRELIASRHSPDGFNIGINVGEAAGQTVFHLHVHLIPRYKNDVQGPAVLNRVAAAPGQVQGSLPRPRRDKAAWSRLLRDVARTIEVMPLWKLETVGPDRLHFLYPNVGKGDRLELHGEAVYCLRRFRDLIGNMNRCFDCADPIRGEPVVDHFVPWVPPDARRTRRVAGWAYAQAEGGGATVWQRGRDGLTRGSQPGSPDIIRAASGQSASQR